MRKDRFSALNSLNCELFMQKVWHLSRIPHIVRCNAPKNFWLPHKCTVQKNTKKTHWYRLLAVNGTPKLTMSRKSTYLKALNNTSDTRIWILDNPHQPRFCTLCRRGDSCHHQARGCCFFCHRVLAEVDYLTNFFLDSDHDALGQILARLNELEQTLTQSDVLESKRDDEVHSDVYKQLDIFKQQTSRANPKAASNRFWRLRGHEEPV